MEVTQGVMSQGLGGTNSKRQEQLARDSLHWVLVGGGCTWDKEPAQQSTRGQTPSHVK